MFAVFPANGELMTLDVSSDDLSDGDNAPPLSCDVPHILWREMS
jgi:hypothetical protein